MFTADHFKAICELESEFITPYFDQDCPAHTIGFYAGVMAGKQCKDLNDQDVSDVMTYLTKCAPYYFDRSLSYACVTPDLCPDVPPECVHNFTAYKMFHYFTDVNFMKDGDIQETELRYSMIYFPQEWNYTTDELKDYFLDHLDLKDVENKLITVPGMSLNLFFDVFPGYMWKDMLFYCLAMVIVVIILLMYLHSVVLMGAVCFNVVCSLLLSYFLYFVVFRFPFFPFINLTSGLLIIAITADDVFIVYDVWLKTKNIDKVEDPVECMAKTFHHAAMSIFVTSFTTSAALFANFVSSITVVRCFAMFAGTAVLINFVFMLTAVPALVILMERGNSRFKGTCKVHPKLVMIAEKVEYGNTVFWSKLLPNLVIKAWFIFVLLFFSIGVIGIVIVFIAPKLRLSELDHIMMFKETHPFEVYGDALRENYRFEVDGEERHFDVQWIWGLDGKDRGNWLDPDDWGSFKYDKGFNITKPSSQEWHLAFCKDLKSQPFVYGLENEPCIMSVIQKIVTGKCDDILFVYGIDISPCCETTFPLDQGAAETCFQHTGFMQVVYAHGAFGQFLYDNEGTLKLMRYYIRTVYAWTASNNDMEGIIVELNDFTDSSLSGSPREVSGGWYTTGRLLYQLLYYDLQKALVSGALIGVFLSLAIGFIVLLITSMNIIITTYAIFTISLVIGATVASMVLQGWTLNVSECITLTLAVGLSIDFTIHLGVSFKLSQGNIRADKVIETLATVGSAVFMAGLTTFAAGASVAPFARVIVFRRFAIFLMLCMVISVSFAIFFFLGLNVVIGPVGEFGEVLYMIEWVKGKIKGNNTPPPMKTRVAPSGSSINGIDREPTVITEECKKRPPSEVSKRIEYPSVSCLDIQSDDGGESMNDDDDKPDVADIDVKCDDTDEEIEKVLEDVKDEQKPEEVKKTEDADKKVLTNGDVNTAVNGVKNDDVEMKTVPTIKRTSTAPSKTQQKRAGSSILGGVFKTNRIQTSLQRKKTAVKRPIIHD